MKNITTILLLFLCLTVTAQDWRPAAVIGYHVGTVVIGAVADGLFDEGHKDWGHALHALEVGALIGGPFIFNIKRSDALSYILSYGFIRLSLFDLAYNVTRDMEYNYVGSTSGYDKFISKIPPDGRAWIKTWSLVVGFAIPINHL